MGKNNAARPQALCGEFEDRSSLQTNTSAAWVVTAKEKVSPQRDAITITRSPGEKVKARVKASFPRTRAKEKEKAKEKAADTMIMRRREKEKERKALASLRA